MKRLVIAIDCDDVLVGTSGVIVERYNQKYGTHITLEDMYDERSNWQASDREEAILRMDTLLRDDRILKDVKPLVGAIDAIKRLAAVHELHVVTGRQSYMEAETKELVTRWFDGCFESIEMTNYIVSANSSAPSRSKGEVCKRLGADMLIDDHTAHLESVLSMGIEELIIFGDYPWSYRQAAPVGSIRCQDWQSVEHEVEKVAKR